jgi:aminodeoxychorismate synthase component I
MDSSIHNRPAVDKRTGADTPAIVPLDSISMGPVELMDAVRREMRYPFLLDSADGPDHIARYSLLGGDPFLTFTCHKGTYRIEYADGNIVTGTDDPLKTLDDLIKRFKPASADQRFAGCAAGYVGYDAKNYIESLPDTVDDDLNMPEICFGFYDTIVLFDRATKTARIMACAAIDDVPGLTEPAADRAAAWNRRIHNAQPPAATTTLNIGTVTSTHQFPAYRDMVMRCKDYIVAGDIFQANLSQRLGAEFQGDTFQLYRSLRAINPSPFAFYMDWDDVQLVSCSPERLVRTRGPIIDTRPIAGTRPRGKTREDDSALHRELRLNEKEAAEHIMIVDMARNDIGRVARYGTVLPDELRVIEQYSHVFHIVSNITGRMRPGATPLDVIRAVFPGASITGVPKVRCMEIIDELEPVRRGPYTGSAGYIGFNGEMDLNIIIRTFVLRNGTAYIQVGGGIVADSEPRHEFDETLHKAQALIEALKR